MLTRTERDQITREFAQEAFVGPRKVATLDTLNIDAASVALEAYLVRETTNRDNALPEPFKSSTTPSEKHILLKSVVNRLKLR